jgi:LysR family transcriptional regulator (chromosome initiation inhibitor)
VPSTLGFLHFALEGMAWGMQPVMLARAPIDRGQLAELNPGTPIRVMLYWTVARLQASALKTLTDAVRRVARTKLIQLN